MQLNHYMKCLRWSGWLLAPIKCHACTVKAVVEEPSMPAPQFEATVGAFENRLYWRGKLMVIVSKLTI